MAEALASVFRALMAVNSVLLHIGRNIAWVALALMVFVILLQVVFRYVFNSALPWPDEVARFLMLWMTGLIAPSAMRWGGFVAIDMLEMALPKRASLFLTLVLLCVSAVVLVMAIQFGWKHTMGFGGNFESSSMKLPLDWIGLEAIRVKLRYMYGSLLVGVILLLSVTVELILRCIIGLLKPDLDLPDDPMMTMAGTD